MLNTVREDRWTILAITTFGIFLTSLDSTIVVIALPAIMRGLSSTFVTSLWTLTGYMLVSTVMLLPAARLSDFLGRKTVFLGGFVVFAGASALCGVAPSAGFLIAARLLQGTGGAVLASVGPPIITEVFPPGELGRALGLNSAAWVVGTLLGPVAGGLLVASIGWRAVFYVAVPFALAAIFFGIRLLPGDSARAAALGPQWTWAHFDVPGTLWLTTSLSALLLALTEGLSWGWTSPVMLGLYIGALVTFVLFVRQEQQAREPLFDLKLFSSPRFSTAQVVLLLGAIGIGSITYLMTYYLQGGLRLDPVMTGLLLIPLAAPQLVTSPLGGFLADRFGPDWLIVAGLALVTLAEAFLGRLPNILSLPFVIVTLGIIGVANGAWFPPLIKVVMGGVPKNRLGAASGMFFTVRNTAYALSLTLALVFAELGLSPSLSRTLFMASAMPNTQGLSLALMAAVRGAFMWFAALSALAVLGSLWLHRMGAVSGLSDEPAQDAS